MNVATELGLVRVGDVDARLAESRDESSESSVPLATRVARLVMDGAAGAVFELPDVAALLGNTPDSAPPASSSPLALLRSCGITSAAPEVRLAVGAAALVTFVQLNYTGPNLPELPCSPFARTALVAAEAVGDYDAISREIAADGEVADAVPYLPIAIPRLKYEHYNEHWHVRAVAELALDGEDAYPLAFYPAYLLLAHQLLVPRAPDGADEPLTAPVWRLRCARVHREVLLAPSITLYEAAVGSAESVIALPLPPGERALRVRLHMEAAVASDLFGRHDLCRRFTAAATELAGMSVEVTGALGKRTKFQTFTTTHLVVVARSGLAPASAALAPTTAALASAADGQADASADVPADASSAMARATDPKPRLIKNEDWDLLEELAFETPRVDEPLTLDELTVLLARCLDVRSHNPASVLTDEEISPFARRVLSNPSASWLIAATALLVRSRLEVRGKKTLERAMAQVQSLLDERNVPAPPSGLARLDRFFSLTFPPWWELQRELGAVFLKLGLSRAALDMYEPLQMWDEIVACYVAIGSVRRAEIVVRAQLERHPTPLMLCVLGDIRDERELYARAWELSGARFPRAQRALGSMAFRAKDYAGAIEHFELALAINPIFPALWFTLGMAAMFIDSWETGANAFSRTVQYDPENGEAWANLASIYQRMGEPRRAFTCLTECLKHKRESWRMWENYLYVCMQLGEHVPAMRAVREVLETSKDAKRVDSRVVRALVGVYAGLAATDAESREARFYRARLDDMFNFVLDNTTTNVRVWEAFAALAQLDGEYDVAYERTLSQMRAAQAAPGWEHDAALFAEVVYTADALVEALARLEDVELRDEAVTSLRFLFASVYKQSARMLEADPERTRLRALIVRIGGDPDENLAVLA